MSEPQNMLASRSAATAADLEALLAEARRRAVPVWELAAADPRFSEEAIADAFVVLAHVPRVRVAAATIAPDALGAIPEKVARRHTVLPLSIEQRTIVVALANPLDIAAIEDVEFASSLKLKAVVATRTELVDAIARHYRPEDNLRDFVANVRATDDFRVLRYDAAGQVTEETASASAARSAEAMPVVKLCNLTLYDAVKAGASDIHVEPGLNEVEIRMRQDGALRSYSQVPKWLHEPFVSRLKILARLDIAERRVPQDGRIGISWQGRTIDIRVSTLPTHFGEKVVMRVLGAGKTPSLADVGVAGAQLEALQRAAAQAQGMILVTGPTGSGKTTTLYALLARRQAPDVNIVTIEDPIEYQLPGVTQVQVNTKTGLTFDAALRSILRQDPDVILVGEIRDVKTADTALQAAMTGHLVLSSLHTNGAVATISRLLDLGVDAMVVASSVSLVVAQRLVRRTCLQCREPYAPALDALGALGMTTGTTAFMRGRGCPACGHTGFAGRAGLFEIVSMTPALKALIHKRAGEHELRQAAARQQGGTLLESGVALVHAGVTTPEEVVRVVGFAQEEAAASACPHCRARIEPAFAICPYCRHSLRSACEACGQELNPEWPVCPYCRKNRGGEERRLPAAAIPLKQPRILVVDDDALIRRSVSAALTRLDVQPQISTAVNGREAMARIEQELPDLIVLDVMMPEMDGFEVCEALRRDLRTAFVPIIMLTRNSDEQHRTKGFLVGTDDFMAKPFTVPELTARVNRLLRRTYGL